MDMMNGLQPAATRPARWVISGLARSDDLVTAATREGVDVVFAPDGVHGTSDGSILLRVEGHHGTRLSEADIVARWHTPPYAMPIRLTRYVPGEAAGRIIDSAVIGTRGSKAEFIGHAERTARRLVADAIRGRSRLHMLPEPAWTNVRPARGWIDRQRTRWRERLLTEWWSVGATEQRLSDILTTGNLGVVRWAHPETGTAYLADPFPWPGANRLLCEEMPLAGGHGRIVALPIGCDDGLEPGSVVLGTQHHHSYPCTLEDDGTTWLLPEDCERGSTILYRLEEGTEVMPVCAVAPGRRLADSTLFHHAGRFWIACTDLDIGGHDNLCILHAARPEGPWLPHRLEPVKIDIRGARPAGSVFRVGDQLYRPGQDCTETYGGAITIHRIDRLTETEYLETPMRVLRPDPAGPFPDGLHTLVSDGRRTWVDGKRYVFDWSVLTDKARRRLRRGFGDGAGA
jgi:hypothetical protein